MAQPDVMMAYVTTASRAEALKLGRALVEERLAACANVFDGMTAIYRWDGKLQEEDEAVLVLKTSARQIERLTERLVELHSYDLPCVVAWRIETGHAPYLDWVRDESGRA
ncbi:MAG: divalent-cation tolerance protein CutA [Alphaproteobacteria bacterium]